MVGPVEGAIIQKAGDATAPNDKTSNNLLENDGLVRWKDPVQGRQARPVHVLKGELDLLQQGGVHPALHALQRGQPVILPQLEGLFIAFVLKFQADPLVHFEHGNFQRGMFDLTDDAHRMRNDE